MYEVSDIQELMGDMFFSQIQTQTNSVIAGAKYDTSGTKDLKIHVSILIRNEKKVRSKKCVWKYSVVLHILMYE